MSRFKMALYSMSVFSVLLGNVGATSAKDTDITTAEAKKIASQFIETSPYADEWDDSEIKLKTKLFDIDDSELAYYFSVEDHKKKLGYIIVSATEDSAPILQYGEGTIDESLDSKLDKGNKVYYLGGLQHMYAKNSDDLEKKFQKKKEDWIKDLENKENTSDSLVEEVRELELKPTREKIKKSKTTSMEDVSATATTSKTLYVTRLYQRMSGVTNPVSACGPTTGAMITNYLKSRGYNVLNGTAMGGNYRLINHLYTEMGTGVFGTTSLQYINGMKKHLDHNYPNKNWTTWTLDASGRLTHFKDNIINDKPVALRFDYFISDNTYVSYHFVAGIGFDSNGNVGIKDPDNGSTNTGTHWINWSANEADMEMSMQNFVN